jgi:hypothetical protein
MAFSPYFYLLRPSVIFRSLSSVMDYLVSTFCNCWLQPRLIHVLTTSYIISHFSFWFRFNFICLYSTRLFYVQLLFSVSVTFYYLCSIHYVPLYLYIIAILSVQISPRAISRLVGRYPRSAQPPLVCVDELHLHSLWPDHPVTTFALLTCSQLGHLIVLRRPNSSWLGVM